MFADVCRKAAVAAGFLVAGSFSTIADSETAPADAPALTDRLQAILEDAYGGDRPGAAAIVYRNGETLLHSAVGLADLQAGTPLRPDHRFRTASVTKQITGAVVMRLVEDGLLDLDADIRTYLPDFADKGSAITLRHLLGHTSGLYNYTDNDAYEAVWTQDFDVSETRQFFENEPLYFPTGDGFFYSNSGYALACMIVEAVTGLPYRDVAADLIFSPAGMTDTHFQRPGHGMTNAATDYWPTETGYREAEQAGRAGIGDGEVVSTVGDLLNWFIALENDTLFSTDTKAEFFTSTLRNDGSDTRYAKGLFLGRVGDFATFEHGGNVSGWRAYVIMVPEQNAFVALLANATDVDEGLVASALVKTALGIDLSGPPPVLLPRAALEQFAGSYAHGPEDIRRIRIGDNGLQSSRGGRQWYDLVAIGESRFMFEGDPDTQISFDPGGLSVSYRYGADHNASRIED